MDSVFSFVVGFLTAAMSLLGFVQQHPELPQASRDQAQQVAQQAITQATNALKAAPTPVVSTTANQTSNTYTSAHLIATPTNGSAPLTVTFEGEIYVPYNQRGSAVMFFGDDVSDVMGRTGPETYKETWTHTYSKTGEYDAVLVISSISNVDSDIQAMKDPYYSKNQIVKKIRVSVSNQSTSGSLQASPISGNAPLAVSFSIQASAGGQFIDFGDGSNPCSPLTAGFVWDEGGCNAPAFPQTFTHTYTKPGTYKVVASRHLPSTSLGTVTITVMNPSQDTTLSAYTHPQYGFSFEYPQNWSITAANPNLATTPGALTETFLQSNDKQHVIRFIVYDIANLSYEFGCHMYKYNPTAKNWTRLDPASNHHCDATASARDPYTLNSNYIVGNNLAALSTTGSNPTHILVPKGTYGLDVEVLNYTGSAVDSMSHSILNSLR